jgi:hypothetical protein
VPAGYPAGDRRPFGIAFLGPAWSEPALIGYPYDVDQATAARGPPSASPFSTVFPPFDFVTTAFRHHVSPFATADPSLGT